MNAPVYALVELALDRWVRQVRKQLGRAPVSFRAETLAGLVNVSREEISTALQQYRYRQGKHPTKYVIACRRYGRAARWSLLALPGTDPASVQAARARATKWATDDMAARFARDLVHELAPGLHNTAQDRRIEQATQHAEQALTNLVQLVALIIGIP